MKVPVSAIASKISRYRIIILPIFQPVRAGLSHKMETYFQVILLCDMNESNGFYKIISFYRLQDKRYNGSDGRESIVKRRIMTDIWLLEVNLFISAFTFGGGYTVVPMVRRFFVERKQYFTEEDLIDMAAVAQSTPGAIAINLSALAGYKAAGMAGALISCFAAVTPPLVVLTFVSAFYKLFVSNTIIAAILKGMEAGVAALMVDLIADMCFLIVKKRSFFFSAMIPLAFMANFVFDINVAAILFACCCLCILEVFCKKRREK